MNRFLRIPMVAIAATTVFSPLCVQAENSITKISGVVPSAMSSDGKIMAGTLIGWNADWTQQTHKGFIWTVEGGTEWRTNYDGTDCSNSGIFKAVNNLGMIAGAIKDADLRLPAGGGGGIFAPAKYNAPEEELGAPINHAAVWRDGKVYILPDGLSDIEAYSDENDGTQALGISEDGMFVIGASINGYFPERIMGWQYDPEKDEYNYVEFVCPADASMAELKAISPDAEIVVGETSYSIDNWSSIRKPTIWRGPNDYKVFDIPGAGEMGGGLGAWSADCNKLLVYNSSYTDSYLGIIDIAADTLTQISLPEGTTNITPLAITNNGSCIFKLMDSNWAETAYVYDAPSDTLLPLTEYLNECAAGLEGATSLSTADIKLVSGDGSEIVFEVSDFMSSSASILHLDNPGVLCATAPTVVRLYHNSPTEVTLMWEGVKSVPEGITLRGYEAYIDGKLVTKTETSTPGGEFTAISEAELGETHIGYVKTLYTKADVDKSSLASTASRTYVSSYTELLSFDNFDNCQLDSFGNPRYNGDDWYCDMGEGNPLIIQWQLSVRDWDNNNPFMQMTFVGTTPWECGLVSRYHDATEYQNDNLFLSFYVQTKEVNSFDQIRTTDYLDIEYSTDGREWQRLDRIIADDMEHAKWSFHKINISKLCGKAFQLRFNANGEGQAQLQWSLDCININDEEIAPAPQGIRVVSASTDGLELTWQNTKNTWDVSHLINSYVECDANAGNEGEPIMMAIDLAPDKLAHHKDEYISGVSAFLFDPVDAFESSRAEAVVYENGKEVARTAFTGPFDVASSTTAWLPRPVKINEGSTYRIAVSLSRYTAEFPPLYYQNVAEFIPGVTDLFSEDDGETWHSMYEELSKNNTNAEEVYLDGKGIWSIHADISTDATPIDDIQKDPEIIGYNVYRNGEQINPTVVYAPYMRFLDRNPLGKAIYTVQAFYRDGRVSPISAPFEYNSSSMDEISKEAPAVSVEDGMIRITSGYDVAEVFALGGHRMAVGRNGATISTFNLPAGVYLLRIENGLRVDTVKVMVK